MKVCFFSHYSVSNKDGASLSMHNIINELVNRGIEVTVVIPNAKNLNFPHNEQVKYYIVPMFAMRMDILKKGFLLPIKFFIKSLYNKVQTAKLVKILRNEQIDMIHINGLDSEVGAIVAKKLEIPYVWHIRQYLGDDLGYCLYAEEHIYRLVKEANAVIGIADDVKKHFESILERDIHLIYNGVPVEKYFIPNREILTEGKVKMLLAGRISVQKGQLVAIKAIESLLRKNIYNVSLTLVGSGQTEEYRREIVRYITDHHLEEHVQVLDLKDDLSDLRKQHDIGLTCSQREAFGRVTVENMMAGMLVICSNTGGTLEIIRDHENGLLYNVDDPEDLSEKIEMVFNNIPEMKKIAKCGNREAVKKYSIDRVVDQILDLYKQVMK